VGCACSVVFVVVHLAVIPHRGREGVRDLDDDEFTRFVRADNAALMRTAWLLTGDRGLAEDLVQSALTRAYGQWAKVQRADDRSAYVQRLMINLHLSWRRRLTNSERVVESVPDRGAADDQSAHAERDRMRTALSHLPLRARTAVVLRYFEDLSEAETARLMGCSVSTVNNHVTRGLAALRALLTTPGDDALTSLPRRRP
jgi:RNA polymerase sigma-70 factor (sigma-E family)